MKRTFSNIARSTGNGSGAALGWTLTYADFMGLLMCFFLVLFSMSDLKKDARFEQALASIQGTFGIGDDQSGVGLVEQPANSLVTRLGALQFLADSTDDSRGIDPLRITQVKDGLQVSLNGSVAFARSSDQLQPEGRELLAEISECISNYQTKVLVRGHASSESEQDGMGVDLRDLSYARANAVARELEAGGVSRNRLVVLACGDSDPLIRPAVTDEQNASNRRVEIVITEDFINDAAQRAALKLKGSPDAR